jgi:hypothetical protein
MSPALAVIGEGGRRNQAGADRSAVTNVMALQVTAAVCVGELYGLALLLSVAADL